MSTKAVQEKNADQTSFTQKINDFLSKYRVIIVTVLIAVVVALIGLFVVTAVRENNSKAAYETVEDVLVQWEKARADTDKTSLASKEDGFIASLQKVASSNKHSFGGARAYMTIAEIYFSRKDWKTALDQYLAAVKAAPKAYTAGLSYFNAGICADELGNADEAIKYLNQAIALENFVMKPRAMFNIARIEEQRSKTEAAIAMYDKIAEQYPDDEWTMLAKSRKIALKIK
jgi:tetratricopeptide (TPR) repeat protein